MYKEGFDSEKYLKIQSEEILERIKLFENKLYLEFGGKMFDDLHAARVLPGFEPDIKIKLLKTLADKVEIVMVISSKDIIENRIQADHGITYGEDMLRLITKLKQRDLHVSSVVITLYDNQKAVDTYKEKLERLGHKVYYHRVIEGYPTDIKHILSEDGFGKNDYIETTRPLVVVAASGSSSGKMAVCLSQLYQDAERGISSGYAKFEKFPVWDLPKTHPINLAYEAATIDIKDKVVIDPYHLENYNEIAVNYNRDTEAFPVLKKIFEKISGEKIPYLSPTKMGVNTIGKCIADSEICEKAAKQEIIRRYFKAKKHDETDSMQGLKLLMQAVGVVEEDREVVFCAREKSKKTGVDAVAMQLTNGEMITGKSSSLLSASSAALINAIKFLSGFPDEKDLISQAVIEGVQELNSIYLKSDAQLNLEPYEALTAISVTAITDDSIKETIRQLSKLEKAELHSTKNLSPSTIKVLAKLGINATCEVFKEEKYEKYNQ